MVEHENRIRNRAMSEDVGHSTGVDCAAIDPEFSVSVRTNPGGPQPTSIRFVDFRPKAWGNWEWASMLIGHVSPPRIYYSTRA